MKNKAQEKSKEYKKPKLIKHGTIKVDLNTMPISTNPPTPY